MIASPVQPVTDRTRSAGPAAPTRPAARHGLLRYAATATAARIGDAGAGIGVVLLAVDRAGPVGGPLAGGLLAASLTAPHALGPWVGRVLDGRYAPRRVLAVACVVYGVALAVATLVLVRGPLVAAVPALVTAGATGPLLTGGFSALVGELDDAHGRARGIDVVTYGIAGTAGPAAVAALAALSSPATGLFVVAASVVVAGCATATLPCGRRAAAPGERPPRRAADVLLRSRPLRAVTLTTTAAAAGGGALGVVAVLLAVDLGRASGEGGWFVAALGLGNLAGAVWTVARPLHREPVAAALRLAVVLAVAEGLVAVVPSFALGVVAFGAVGVLTAPFVTATLVARERYAPPGRTREVFVAMSGLKVAAGAGGTALAGVLAAWGARPLAAASAALLLLAVVAVGHRAVPGTDAAAR